MTAGLKTLLFLIIRRDRVKLPLSIVLFVASLLSMVPLLRDVYGDVESLAMMQGTFTTNPAVLFMTGPMDGPNLGALMTVETLLWWGMAIAFINTLMVVRHTRHNEETGAQELLLSGQTHRATGLVAVIIMAVIVNGLIALGLGAGLQLLDVPWGSDQSWLFGLSLGLFGLVWAAVAAIVVQLVEHGRTANSMLAALIGLGFVVRGIGDFLGKSDSTGLHQPAWLSDLSPFGWLQMTRSLTHPEWWPLVISVGFSVVAVSLALVLLARRDVGAGLLPTRKGRPRASAFLRTPLGLTWKLQKNIFIGWLVGIVVMTGTIGALVPQMSDVYNNSDEMKQMIETIGGVGELVPSFMSAMIAITSLLVFAYVLQGLGRLRGEESNGHLESLLATRLSRLKWQGLHVGTVLVGGFLLLAVVGGGLALCINTLSDTRVDMWEYIVASLSYAPVMVALGALYLLLFGILPRVAGVVTWLYFGFVAFVSWLGPMLKLDDWIMKLSVMEHLASPPVEDIKLAPIVAISAVGVALIIVGMIAWRQRNLLEK